MPPKQELKAQKQEQEMKVQLAVLEFKRNSLVKKITTLYNLSLDITITSADFSQFKVRSDKLEQNYDAFCKSNAEALKIMSLLGETDFSVQEELCDQVDERYFFILGVKEKLDANETLDRPRPTATRQPGVSQPMVRLPKLNLPIFSGNVRDWPNFKDLYLALVHDNTTLSDIQRFQYLVTCTAGDALSLVKTLPLTTVNYNLIWDKLKKRYDNKRLLAVTYIEEIINIAPLTSESPSKLRILYDTLSENIAALKALNLPVDLGGFLLLHTALHRLDKHTRQLFERKYSQTEFPTLENCVEFIHDHCKSLESAQGSEVLHNLTYTQSIGKLGINQPQTSIQKSNFGSTYRPNTTSRPNAMKGPKYTGKPNDNSVQRTLLSRTSSARCSHCNGEHIIYGCPDFLKKSPELRKEWVTSKKSCFNCLSDKHMLNRCASTSSCRQCGRRHHTLLHLDLSPTTIQPSVNVEPEKGGTSDLKHSLSVTSCFSSEKTVATVLLGTALVHIQDASGNFQTARLLIDPGSQASFITEHLLKRLGLKRERIHIPISGLSQQPVLSGNGVVQCTLKPLHSTTYFPVKAIVLSNITSKMPVMPLTSNIRDQFIDLRLADDTFDIPGPIDFLLGADLYPKVFDGKRLSMPEGLPTPYHTVFGWVLIGGVNVEPNHTQGVSTFLCSTDPSLDSVLKQFWETEQSSCIESLKPTTQAEDTCEKFFVRTHSRDSSGRYVVRLPFKEDRPCLGDSYPTAVKRFKWLEQRLERQPETKDAYHHFMQEYESLGHMELVKSSSDDVNYIIPHHAVTKESSSTTKLRVVFDASAKTSAGMSLNDHLLVGPKLQKDIVQIILNFRQHPVVLTADICKMYRQILMHPDDRLYQAILWRNTLDDPVQQYLLNTVTYGVSSAPFLAMRTLRQLVIDEGHHFPLAAQVLSKDIFVDDIVTGCATLEEAQHLKHELIGLLQAGGFELRKWASNKPQLLADIPQQHFEVPLQFDKDGPSVIKVLGLQWLSSTDEFTYSANIQSTLFTKRSILSHIARIFDPLGWLSPIVFWSKRLMQHLWIIGVDWDELPNDNIKLQWSQFLQEIPFIKNLKIPRLIFSPGSSDYQLHGFCDASEDGYAATVYLRGVHSDGHVSTSLVVAKSRVAPMKQLSIPRLELCGAVLLARLLAFSTKSLSVNINQLHIFAWTDSTIVLNWIRTSSRVLKTFVANRVSEIQDKTNPSQWHHVPSEANPADCASRGLTPCKLISHNLWWQGPNFLMNNCDQWPEQSWKVVPDEDLPEFRPKVFVTTTKALPAESEILLRFSSLTKLKRVTAWCRRFISNARTTPEERIYGPLSLKELQASLNLWVKHVQHEYFKEDISRIRNNRSSSIRIQRLNPFLDQDGLLKVGGRLRNSSLPSEEKHPLLLPKASHFVAILIDHFHLLYLHAGPRTLLSLIQRHYWIMSARNAIRNRIFKCLRCFKLKATSLQPLMADLPAVRVQAARPFIHVGVDIGGPITTKTDKTRKPQFLKSYICLFICLSSKAVHLETISGLSTEAFLTAFSRFVSRRGYCSDIYSDQGTNFVGANKQLSEFTHYLSTSPQRDLVENSLANKNVKWHFNPPSAPHFGGIWEAGIKSAKFHIKRVIGEQILTFEELTTLLTQIEAVLNSRPLCGLSTDPSETDVLTPAHFLIGDHMFAIPQPDFTTLPLNRLSRWQLIHQASQHFWKRWSREYLHTLQQRGKWTENSSNIKIDDLVLIRDDNLPSLHWLTGRVTKIHPGTDGVVRVITLRTKRGSLIRPVVKVCPLPVDQ